VSNAIIVKPLGLGTVTASSTAAGYDAANVASDYLGVVWKSATGAATRSITLDLGSDVALDFAALLGCTGATGSWTLTVEAATAAQGPSFPGGSFNSGALAFLAGATMPESGRGIGWWSNTTPVTGRYWRFTIGGLASAAATVARIVIGRKLSLERNYVFGAAFGVRDFGSVDFSQRGVLLRRRSVKLPVIGISFANAYRDEVETAIMPLVQQVGGTEPIFLCTDPAADALRQKRCYFGPVTGELGVIQRGATAFEWKVNLASLIG
jgi:hypothetical protein